MADRLSQEQAAQFQQLEQSLQIILMQKQQMQMQLGEIEHALKELKATTGQPHKMVGGILISVEKKALTIDLESQQDLLIVRLKKMDEQETAITSRAESLKRDILGSLKKEGER